MDRKAAPEKCNNAVQQPTRKCRLRKYITAPWLNPVVASTAIIFNTNTLTFPFWTTGHHSVFQHAVQGHQTCRRWTQSGASPCSGGIPLLYLRSVRWQHLSQSMATFQKLNPITMSTVSASFLFKYKSFWNIHIV